MKLVIFHKNRLRLGPITFGGLILASAMCGLWFGPATNSNDLLAASMASIFLSLMLALGILSFLAFAAVKRSIKADIFVKSSDISSAIMAGDKVNLTCRLQAIKLLPFTRLHLELIIDDSSLELGRHNLKGNFPKEVLLEEQIIFPHRGVWTINSLRISVQDPLGLWNFSCIKELSDTKIKIEPPRRDSSTLAVLSSTYTTGDAVPMGEKRAGDFYDLKAYAPSDGISRIAWKIFARRGELITRQPEKEVRPEGKALIFCLAGPKDDQICAEAIAYIKLLESMEIEVIFGCEGAKQSQAAKNSKAALDLLIVSARENQEAFSQDVASEINTFLETQALGDSVFNILFFVGETRLIDTKNANTAEALIAEAARFNLEPVVICREPTLLLHERSRTQSLPLKKIIRRAIFVPAKSNREAEPYGLNSLITASSRRNWNVLTCP